MLNKLLMSASKAQLLMNSFGNISKAVMLKSFED